MVPQLREARDPDAPVLVDPFDELSYGFDRTENGFMIWSSGPDRSPGTDDDLEVEFSSAAG